MKNEILNASAKRKLVLMVVCFAAVYLIWGSTYLAIKYAIETLPTFIMAGTRFLAAGSVLWFIARLSPKYEKATLIQWRTSLIVGALLLGIGNGAVVVAEHYIPSSLAALLVATLPFWMVLMSWAFMGKGRPNFKVAAGLLMGFIGVALLIPFGDSPSGTMDSGVLIGIVCVIFATLGWAAGSLYGSKAPTVTSPIHAAGMQMLSGGTLLMLTSIFTGEWKTFDVAAVSKNSWIALAYLIVFGAIMAYTAYSWLMKNASPAAISTYAYVNPVIAVILGWVIAGETLTGQTLVGAAIIVASVALITSTKKKAITQEGEEEIHSSTTPRGNSPLAVNSCS